jgi:4-carboxymuconolactone decarboxylase
MNNSLASQPAEKPPLNLRGNRFKPLTWETLSPAQLTMVESVMSGQRGSMQGPYNVLLRSPELGNLAQQFGAHTRYHSSLPLALNELAILLVARFWSSPFVWWAHKRIALEAGLDAALIQAIGTGEPAPSLPADVAAVHGFCSELLQMRRVGDATYAALVAQFGETGVVDVMGTMGYYTLVSMSLNVDQYPLPDGADDEMPPLKPSSLALQNLAV